MWRLKPCRKICSTFDSYRKKYVLPHKSRAQRIGGVEEPAWVLCRSWGRWWGTRGGRSRSGRWTLCLRGVQGLPCHQWLSPWLPQSCALKGAAACLFYLTLKTCLHNFQFLNLRRALMSLQHLVLKFDPLSLSVGKRRWMRWSGWTWRSPPRCRCYATQNRLSLPDELGNLRCFSMCTR